MDDHQGSKRAPGLTRGQMATALRIGSGAAEWLPGHPEPWAGTDGSRDPARGSGRTGAGITLAMVVAGTLAVSAVTGNRGNLGDSGDGPPSAGGGRGSIQRDGVGTGAIQATDSRQEQQKMFGRLTGVAAATAVGVSTTIAGAQATAVQWRVEDGGNGHWYQFIPDLQVSWDTARQRATSMGGDLATITDSIENDFAFGVLNLSSQALVPGTPYGPFIGAIRRGLPTWQWVDGTPWSYQPWGPGEPNDSSGGAGPEECLAFLVHPDAPRSWNDVTANGCAGSNCELRTSSGYLVEWSADCNADGIVDYGQILLGQLSDLNANGIPDTCEASCSGVDLDSSGTIDGADLGTLLANWGVVAAGTPADIDGDGTVGGADLGLLLSFWGPCAP